MLRPSQAGVSSTNRESNQLTGSGEAVSLDVAS
jgi:hypothetical protein